MILKSYIQKQIDPTKILVPCCMLSRKYFVVVIVAWSFKLNLCFYHSQRKSEITLIQLGIPEVIMQQKQIFMYQVELLVFFK